MIKRFTAYNAPEVIVNKRTILYELIKIIFKKVPRNTYLHRHCDSTDMDYLCDNHRRIHPIFIVKVAQAFCLSREFCYQMVLICFQKLHWFCCQMVLICFQKLHWFCCQMVLIVFKRFIGFAVKWFNSFSKDLLVLLSNGLIRFQKLYWFCCQMVLIVFKSFIGFAVKWF